MPKANYNQVHYCEVCRRPFRSSRKHAKTCSPACRKILSRAGQKSKKKNVPPVTIQQLELLLQRHIS